MDRRLASEGRALEDLDGDAVAPLDLAPDAVGLREEDMGVESEDPCVGLALEEQVEEDGLLLLERAGEGDVRMEGFEDGVDDLRCGQRLDVGLADELCDAPLHRGEPYQP